MKTRGFTLIELLIVIAIIAILAAILFPVFARAREKARQTTCASNLSQFGLALLQYEQDYDEMTPQDQAGSSNYAFPAIFYSYIKSTQVMICPDSTKTALIFVSDSPYGYSYGVNDWYWNIQPSFVATRPYGNPWAPTPLSKFTAPSTTILFGDANCTGAGSSRSNYGRSFVDVIPSGTGLPDMTANPPTWPNASATFWWESRHSGGSNWAFADGHVKWMTFQQIMSFKQPAISGDIESGDYTYFLAQQD